MKSKTLESDEETWLKYIGKIISKQMVNEPLDKLSINLKKKKPISIKDIEIIQKKYESSQEVRDANLAKTMKKALDIYYKEMLHKGELLPVIEPYMDSDNEKAIKILRPQSALTFTEYMNKHPETSADPEKRRQMERKDPKSSRKYIYYKNINISRQKMVKESNKKKILKNNFIPTQQLCEQEASIDLEKFCPDLSVPKTLLPIEKYGRNNTIKPEAFNKYFLDKNTEVKGVLANKSTQ
ncbi:unnamed protein product [Moneuplotes crassus]|uniref:Uncharacterized protein n=1 Tax=Euplotes crassus TaxID=5936 RepID=A0AAD1XKJ5_EUPCR|nr:unnamed protein product [Moneuplotes crassus]